MQLHPMLTLNSHRGPIVAQLAVAGAALLFLGFATAARGAEQTAPDLSGSWKRADDFSQNPNDRPRTPSAEGVRQGSKGRGGGGRTGGGGRGGPGSRSTAPASSRQAGRLPLRTGAEAIELTHSEPSVEIQYADGTTRTVFTSKKARKQAGPEALLADAGKWKGSALIVKSSTSKAKFKETFELSKDGTRLWVTTQLSPYGRPSVTFLQTYERGIVLAIEKPSAESESGQPR